MARGARRSDTRAQAQPGEAAPAHQWAPSAERGSAASADLERAPGGPGDPEPLREGAGRGPPGANDRRAAGREAEDLAAAFLRERGLEILDRNHATRRGEVDLVAREGETLCFVEVRSRTSEAQGGPEETISAAKARRVVVAATDWAARHGALDREIRFDVVAVTLLAGEPPRLEHFRGAFDADGRPEPW